MFLSWLRQFFLLTLDDLTLASFAGLISFFATTFGVVLALFLTMRYDRYKKRLDEKETQRRILTAVRAELETNLVALKEADQKDLYGAVVPVFLEASYESSISSGDFSLLKPKAQGMISLTYLTFRQWNKLGDRMVAMFGSQFGEPAKLIGVYIDAMKKQTKSILELIPQTMKLLDDELNELEPKRGKG